MTTHRFTRFAWFSLGYTMLVIVWGAFVRATGSGAGCGSNWPLCNGEVVPRAEQMETLIEFSHRITSGFALILVLVLYFWARKMALPGDRVRSAAFWSLAFMIGEALIGAGLVLFELVADNASMTRGFSMSLHLGNTFLLLAALTLTAHWSGGGPQPRALWGDKVARLFWLSVGAVFLIGTSGAIAALGDTLFPAGTLAEGVRQDLSPTGHIFVQLRVFHPFFAFGGAVLMLSLVAAVRAEKRPQPARRYATALNVMVLVQLLAGTVNILMHAPVWMQLVHLLLADMLWISLVLTGNAALASTQPAAVRAEAPQPSVA
ncbi:MAG: COX15/CtaA family protein [Acidobacteriota bacterium]